MRRRYLLAIALVIMLSVGGFWALLPRTSVPGCPSVLRHPVVKSEIGSGSFGAVTAFSLPSPERWPNAIAVAPDGSIWFGEEAVPGLAHLFPTNGTLVEFAFPGTYQQTQTGQTCVHKTDVWGVALWRGRVWATDSAQNRLVGLSPSNDTFIVVPLAENDSFPYTLTPAPDGALWFTQALSGQIGTLFPNGTVAEHSIRLSGEPQNSSLALSFPGEPAQIVFASDSWAYYVDSSPLVNGSAIYGFDPGHFSPQQVGGSNQSLNSPDSISFGDGGVWLAQHGGSSLAFYNVAEGSWTVFPTSGVSYIRTTLPYFVQTNGSLVWFNEHYGNRIAVMDFGSRTLTEYSVSNPPAANMSQIDNPLTFALAGGRAWFTELTANKVGFVDASYRPPFSISVNGSSSLSVHRGENVTLGFDLRGESSSPLSIKLSDSDLAASAAGNMTMRADKYELGLLVGSQAIAVTVGVGPGVAPGRYTLMVTATDGLISRSAYLELSVLP